MTNFRVGQKVVFVDDSKPFGGYFMNFKLPVVGTVYTIRAIIPDQDGGSLLLREIRNGKGTCAKTYDRHEVSFACWRFRPVVERNSSAGMEILERIRDGAPVGGENFDRKHSKQKERA